MREILFRGKRIDINEWIEGYYAVSPTDSKSYIYAKDSHEMDIAEDGFHVAYRLMQVIPETVGQFVGLTDKNGKKIFEGNIIVVSTSEKGKTKKYRVEFDNGIFGIRLSTNANDNTIIPLRSFDYIETINPELLEVTE